LTSIGNSARFSSKNARLLHLKDSLFEECNRIGATYNIRLPSGEPKLSAVLAVITSSPNVCCLAKTLRYKTRTYIDPYYSARHRIAIDIILEALYERLMALHYLQRVGTEVPTNVGRLDILLEPSSHGVEVCLRNYRIGVELKTGLSLDLAQIFRYALDVDSLILVRIRTRQVIAIRQAEQVELLAAVVSAWTSRARKLLANPDTVCKHKTRSTQMRLMDSRRLAQDIVRFGKDIPTIVDPTVELVVAELKRLEQCITEVPGHDVG
jgi:hypothetical protein